MNNNTLSPTAKVAHKSNNAKEQQTQKPKIQRGRYESGKGWGLDVG